MMAESWRNTSVEEWGNSIAGEQSDFGAMRRSLEALHKDAASTLLAGMRYIVLIPYDKNMICWYRSADMDAEPTWGCVASRRECYVIGQYMTPEKT